ncbi:hypothetical protein [Nitratireductor rhodophyticola]|uniref:hypothetical protein n=1 Tax=Nitratireductor rhodophyticola TaxID=2854036 RepID=UPI003009D7D5
MTDNYLFAAIRPPSLTPADKKRLELKGQSLLELARHAYVGEKAGQCLPDDDDSFVAANRILFTSSEIKENKNSVSSKPSTKPGRSARITFSAVGSILAHPQMIIPFVAKAITTEASSVVKLIVRLLRSKKPSSRESAWRGKQ